MSNAIPVAILAGCSIIAVAVYLGLSARPVVVVAPALSSAVPVASASAPEQAVMPAAAASLLGAANHPPSTGLDADVASALEKLRSSLVQACWKPAVAAQPTPDHATYMFDLTFDEAGREVARGVSEIDRTSRADVAQCIRAHYTPLAIPARGARTRARVPLTLP
ncbi:MAG TPA: hypothetical protein VGI39_10935 [Polyangiaceae bacterium]